MGEAGQFHEVMRGMDDLMRAGKIYAGICDTPVWQAARMQTLAGSLGRVPLVALQVERRRSCS